MVLAEAISALTASVPPNCSVSSKRIVGLTTALLLIALSVDTPLAAVGMTESDRLAWYRTQANTRTAEAGNDYRKRKNLLRTVSVIRNAYPTSSALSSPKVPRHSTEWHLSSATSVNHQKRFAPQNVHLHLNRMSGPDSSNEQHLLCLLARTREGLERAPVRSFAHAGDFLWDNRSGSFERDEVIAKIREPLSVALNKQRQHRAWVGRRRLRTVTSFASLSR